MSHEAAAGAGEGAAAAGHGPVVGHIFVKRYGGGADRAALDPDSTPEGALAVLERELLEDELAAGQLVSAYSRTASSRARGQG